MPFIQSGQSIDTPEEEPKLNWWENLWVWVVLIIIVLLVIALLWFI